MTWGPEPSEPLNPADRNFLVFFTTVILGLFFAELIRDYQPAKLSALFLLLCWPPLLLLHELGHALLAYLLGWRVCKIVIGFGRPISRFHVGSTRVELRMIPLEGFVIPQPRTLNQVRLKSALIYLAGPGIELLALGLLAWALGPPTLWHRTEEPLLLLAQCFALAVLFSAFCNLVPHQVELGLTTVANDGLGAYRSLVAPLSHFEELKNYKPEEDAEDE